MSSPDNSLIPPFTALVDSFGQVWTRANDGKVLRNGVNVAGGEGSLILWVNSRIFVFGSDSKWYIWDDVSQYVEVGPEQPSPPLLNLQQFIVPFEQLQSYLDQYEGRIKFASLVVSGTLTCPVNTYALIIDVPAPVV